MILKNVYKGLLALLLLFLCVSQVQPKYPGVDLDIFISRLDRMIDTWRWWASRPLPFHLWYEEYPAAPIQWSLEFYWPEKGIDITFKCQTPDKAIAHARAFCEEDGVGWPVKITFKEQNSKICKSVVEPFNLKREEN